MGRELDHAKTYEQIRKIERRAEAFKILHADVDKVRRECELVILLANKRIAHETEVNGYKRLPASPCDLLATCCW
jgi:hypothetical protein